MDNLFDFIKTLKEGEQLRIQKVGEMGMDVRIIDWNAPNKFTVMWECTPYEMMEILKDKTGAILLYKLNYMRDKCRNRIVG